MARTNTAEKTKKIQRLRLVKSASRKTVKVSYLKIVVFCSLLCTVIALGYVIQYSLYNQYSLENDKLMKLIDDKKQSEQELKGKVLGLKSPLRIESIAKNQLKMIKPTEIGHLIYEVKKYDTKIAFKR
jgi:cell division protein FtsL